MIDIKTIDGIAVLTLAHGKANALDIEFCEAIAARFTELRQSDAVGELDVDHAATTAAVCGACKRALCVSRSACTTA